MSSEEPPENIHSEENILVFTYDLALCTRIFSIIPYLLKTRQKKTTTTRTTTRNWITKLCRGKAERKKKRSTTMTTAELMIIKVYELLFLCLRPLCGSCLQFVIIVAHCQVKINTAAAFTRTATFSDNWGWEEEDYQFGHWATLFEVALDNLLPPPLLLQQPIFRRLYCCYYSKSCCCCFFRTGRRYDVHMMGGKAV